VHVCRRGADNGKRLPSVSNFHGGPGATRRPPRRPYSKMDATGGPAPVLTSCTPGNAPRQPGRAEPPAERRKSAAGPARREQVDDVPGLPRLSVARRSRRAYPRPTADASTRPDPTAGMMAYRLARRRREARRGESLVAGQCRVTNFLNHPPRRRGGSSTASTIREALYNVGLGPPFPGSAIQNQSPPCKERIGPLGCPTTAAPFPRA